MMRRVAEKIQCICWHPLYLVMNNTVRCGEELGQPSLRRDCNNREKTSLWSYINSVILVISVRVGTVNKSWAEVFGENLFQ